MVSPRRAAVLGSPIKHSLSPVLHRAAYTALGLTGWEYTSHECVESGLSAFVDGLGEEWVGLSLTMPLKRVALEVATEITPTAAAIGSANTLLLKPGRRLADNTDAPGIRDTLVEAGWAVPGSTDGPDQEPGHPVIIGAGGTAQAAVAALAELGCDPVTVAVRDLTRAEEVSRTAARLNLTIQVRSWEMLPELVASADLVISTVPVQASESLTGLPWRPGGFLLDVLYHPWPTPAAAAAQRLGCTVVPGSAVLLHQAAHQVERMTGQTAPVSHMREALTACFSG